MQELTHIPADTLLAIKIEPQISQALRYIGNKAGIAMAEAAQDGKERYEHTYAAGRIINNLSDLSEKSPNAIIGEARNTLKSTVGWALQTLEHYMPDIKQDAEAIRTGFGIEKKYEVGKHALEILSKETVPAYVMGVS